MRSHRLLPSCALVVFVATASCGLAERHRQHWKLYIYDVERQVLLFQEEHERLPADRTELWTGLPHRSDVWPFVHYRLEASGNFLLWLRPEDLKLLGTGASPVHTPEILNAGPSPGDIFGRFDETGQLLESSWMNGRTHR